MAQLMNAWLRQIIEQELRQAIDWQSSIANDQLKELKRIKVEPNKYRYNGQKLWINIPVVSSNRLHVQFVNFTTSLPPYRCSVADGQFRVAAQFSAECERKFAECSKGREVSQIASGVVLGLSELALVVHTDPRGAPFSLEINEFVAKNILQEAALIGRRNPLDSIEELTSLVTDLAHLLDKDHKAFTLPAGEPCKPKPRVENQLPQVNGLSHNKQNSHSKLVRSAPLSQLPVVALVIQSQPSAVTAPEPIATTSNKPRGLPTLRGRGGFRGRGHGQMGDRRSAHDNMLNLEKSNTYITEEDEGHDSGSDSDQPYKLKDHHVVERRVDSSIDSDPHSARSSHRASPVSMKVAPVQPHSGSATQRQSPILAVGKSGVLQSGEPEEQVVTSPLAQTQPPQSMRAPSGSTIALPAMNQPGKNRNADAAATKSWHGGRQPSRSMSIIPDDQIQVLRQATSLYPPKGRQPFPPGNIPIGILQEESRRAEVEVDQRVNHEVELQRTATQGGASPQKEEQRDRTRSESPTSSPLPGWTPSPSPVNRAKHDQQRQPSLPPDSSNSLPEDSPVKARQTVRTAMKPPPTQQVAFSQEKRQPGHLKGTPEVNGGRFENAQSHQIPGLDLVRTPIIRPGEAQAQNTGPSRPGIASSRSTQQGDDGELETNVPRALGDVQSTPAVGSTQRSQEPRRHTPLSPPRGPRGTQEYSSSASGPAVQVRNTDETRRFRSSGGTSPRIPSTYQPSRSPLAQPARVSKSFDDRYNRPRFGDRTYPSSDWSNYGRGDSYRPEPRSSAGNSRQPPPSARSQEPFSQPAASIISTTRQSHDKGVFATQKPTSVKAVPQTPQSRSSGLPPLPPPPAMSSAQNQSISRPASTQRDAAVRSLVPTPLSRSRDPRAQSQVPAPAAPATPSQSTQNSSIVSQDPAKSISNTKAAFVNKIYNKSGLFSVFTEAYPTVIFNKASFDSIIRYKLWPAREDIPAKMFDDFVIQYKTKYESYVLEQEMQGLEKLSYLDFYRQNTSPQGTINRIITYDRLNEFMTEVSSPVKTIKAEHVESIGLTHEDVQQDRSNSMSNGHGTAASNPAAQDVRPKPNPFLVQTNEKKRHLSSPDEIANSKRMRQRPSDTATKQTEYHTQFRALKSNQSTGETTNNGADDFWRLV